MEGFEGGRSTVWEEGGWEEWEEGEGGQWEATVNSALFTLYCKKNLKISYKRIP